MLDFDTGKLLIIGIVALLVIGPKELPRVLRQLGQWTGKLRRMASEFQGQFMDAMREADLESIKQDVANIAKQAEVHTDFNPVADINREMTAALEAKPVSDAAPPAAQAGVGTSVLEMPALGPPAEVAVLAEAAAPAGEAGVAAPVAPPLPSHLRMPSVEPAPLPVVDRAAEIVEFRGPF
jgi:sec-independent protein translocase protein TatB